MTPKLKLISIVIILIANLADTAFVKEPTRYITVITIVTTMINNVTITTLTSFDFSQSVVTSRKSRA